MLNILKTIYNIIQPSLILLLGTVIVIYINDLRNKIKEEKKIISLKTINQLIEDTVIAINQEITRKIKKGDNGLKHKLTNEEKEYIKNAAKSRINYLSTDSIKRDIENIMTNYDKYVDIVIERKVMENKYYD